MYPLCNTGDPQAVYQRNSTPKCLFWSCKFQSSNKTEPSKIKVVDANEAIPASIFLWNALDFCVWWQEAIREISALVAQNSFEVYPFLTFSTRSPTHTHASPTHTRTRTFVHKAHRGIQTTHKCKLTFSRNHTHIHQYLHKCAHYPHTHLFSFSSIPQGTFILLQPKQSFCRVKLWQNHNNFRSG